MGKIGIMGHENEHKIKLLLLWEILCKYTDEDHPMNTDEIIKKLAEKGIADSRKVLAADIALLNEYGYPHRFLCYFLRAKICNFSYGIHLIQSPSAVGAI